MRPKHLLNCRFMLAPMSPDSDCWDTRGRWRLPATSRWKSEVRQFSFLPGAEEYSERKAHSGGLKNNREFVESCVAWKASLHPANEALFYDPQTSGGLLVSMPPDSANEFLDRYPEAYVIGSVKARADKPLEVVP